MATANRESFADNSTAATVRLTMRRDGDNDAFSVLQIDSKANHMNYNTISHTLPPNTHPRIYKGVVIPRNYQEKKL